jgi:predicted dithiol-disulfide oxidoreductase (DUF899 family)
MATAVLMWVCWNHVTGGGRAIQHVAEISEFFQGTGYAGFPLRRHAECQDRRDGGRADGDARPSRRVLGGRGLADEGDGHGCCDPARWVSIDKDYRFETDDGAASLADLVAGRSQLLIYHFMFGPEYKAGCPTCSAIADGFDGSVVHLANHDVTLCAVSRAPLPKLRAYQRRMGWGFPWASSSGSDFNYDFHASHTKEEWQSGFVDYNFRAWQTPDSAEFPVLDEIGASVRTDWPTYRQEGPGVSAFALDDGVVYHTYSAYERGIDGLWGMYQWLDRAPLGRNETGFWYRRHDEYDG